MQRDLKYQKDICTNFFEVAPGVWGMKDVFVNLYMIVNPFEGNWVLLDAGLKWSAPKIKRMASQLFGENSRPSAIILTHGHFDHVGSVESLAEEWDVPVYAHYLELPYITGRSSYPPADPTVGGGLLAELSFLYPMSPVNVWNRANVLPGDGKVPGLPEWKYIHTPGHTAGHTSFYRERDGVLIAGDAVVTTKTESFFASVFFPGKKLHGPPPYLTPDWASAESSVRKLADLAPEVLATGHGRIMYGPEMRSDLYMLSRYFEELAMPAQGRYIYEPVITDATGVIYVPPKRNSFNMLGKLFAAVTIGVAAYTYFMLKQNNNQRHQELLAYETF